MQIEQLYIDTSAFYALFDRSDAYHEQAKLLWPCFLEDHVRRVTSNYVVNETLTLLQHRLGFEAARHFARDILGILEICWVDAALHQLATGLWMNLGRHNYTLVDCVSFAAMNQRGIEKAFGFKERYLAHGYKLLPEQAKGHVFKIQYAENFETPQRDAAAGGAGGRLKHPQPEAAKR